MLRFANQKLAAASQSLAHGLCTLARLVGCVVRPVLGSWQAPPWLQALGRLLARALQRLQNHWIWLLPLLLLLGAAAWQRPALMAWWQGMTPDQAEPVALSVSVKAPERTRIEDGAGPNPLRLEFSGEAAPLAQVGQAAVGVQIEPALAGKWYWAQARRLEFLPASDWPVGERYTVRLGEQALAPQVQLEQRKLTFNSPAFSGKISHAEFYQDPTQPQVRRALFTLQFSHPVQTAELEKRITLSYDKPCSNSLFKGSGDCSKLEHQISYDKFKQTVTVQSPPLPIPDKSRPVVLQLAAGAVAQRGGNALGGEQTRSVDIPGLFSLQVAAIEPTIVTGENGEPEHVLQVSSSMPVHERELARAVQAWLLPATAKPGESAEDKFDWSADPSQVTEAVLQRAQKIALQAIANEREVSDSLSFRLPQVEGGRYLLVRVAKGLKSPGGYQLGQMRQEVKLVNPFAPQLTILSQGALLALSGEKKLPVLVRDLPGVRVEMGRLLPLQLQHLVTQSSGEFSKPEFYQGIQPDNLVDRFEKEIALRLQPGKAHYEAVDFGAYLHKDANDRRGIFLLKVQGFDPKKKQKQQADAALAAQNGVAAVDNAEGAQGAQGDGEDGDTSGDGPRPEELVDQRLVLVTDLGLVVKKSLNGTRDVFVQSIATGLPVGQAQVEVWGRNGVAIASQNTDASGRASIPNLAGFQREQAPVVLVVRKGGDLSFLPFNRNDRSLDVSRFDVGGLRAAGVPNQMTGYVFSDRGIYRPGDTMHIAMIVKAGNWATSLRDLPLEAEIIDARGLSVRREKLRLGPGGSAEIAHTTQDSSPTGNYTVNLYLPRQSSPGAPEVEGLLIGSTTVKVQEFLPDRSKVTVRLSSQATEGWVSPQDLKAVVDVQNLFGTPAPARRVEGTLTLRPSFPAFRSFPDYAFFDPQRARESQTDELGEVQTSDSGLAEFDLRLSRFASATYQVQVLAKAFEPEGGRSVTAEAQTLVSDLAYLIGTKVDGDTRYISKGAARQARIIAINPQAQMTAVAQLRLQRVERKVLSVLVKQDSGVFRYESRHKETVLDEQPLAIASTGHALALDTGTPGNFAYVVRNAQDQELGRIEYSVAGNANVSRSLDRNAELQLTLDRKDYEPGQEIAVSIRAPYTGAGLITIERDQVYAHAWFKTEQTASVQKITVPKDFEGTGYINVHFVRDPASDEIYMSPLSYGVVPFATALTQRSAKIELTSSELVRPGQTVTMTLKSDQPTRAVVFAVDEGILQVARYQTPNPLAHFFQKRALEVSTLQTLDLVLPEFKKLMQGAAPGGDGDGELGKHLNPFKRKRSKPVAYWSGLVDVNGSRDFQYTVPDSFNGSLRVMAVAVNDQSTAARSTTTTVRGDMVLLPNAPLAMAPGDTVEVGVGLANNIAGSGKSAPIALTLQAGGGLEVVGEATQTLLVNERGEASTKFQLRAKAGANAVLGSSALTFRASHKGLSAQLSEEISVRPASPYVTLVQAGSVRRSGELRSQADVYPEYRRSDLAMSAAPWAMASGLVQYLQAYPHGCTEQITSQALPAVLLANRPELAAALQRSPGAEPGPLPDARQAFSRYLTQLRARQTADGGFGAWPGTSADPFATLYVLQLLLEAKDHQLPVPPDMLSKANHYLQAWLGQGGDTQDSWRQRSQAVYLLTRQGIVAPAALANLREALRRSKPEQAWASDLGAAYLAASYQLVKQEQVASELLAPVWNDLNKRAGQQQRRNVWASYYDPLVHDSLTLHLVARHFPARLKTLPPSVWETMAGMVRDGWYNSLSSASMLLAVDAYFNAVGQNASGKFSAQTLDAQGRAAALALGALSPATHAPVPAGTRSIRLANDSDFPLYYSWAEQGFERQPPDTALSKGMEVTHEYLDAQGQPVQKIKLGDDVTVRVRVRSTDRNGLRNVALVDMLPGGLEPVLQAAGDDDESNADAPIWKKRLGTRGNWELQYADIREDRVVFYGNVGTTMAEVSYQARATNVGDFVVPPAYGEAMYDRRVFARSAGTRIQVVAP